MKIKLSNLFLCKVHYENKVVKSFFSCKDHYENKVVKSFFSCKDPYENKVLKSLRLFAAIAIFYFNTFKLLFF